MSDMANPRKDDLQQHMEDLVARAKANEPEPAELIKRQKDINIWHGEAVAPLEKTADDLLPGGIFENGRYRIRLKQYVPGAFIHVSITYTSRGANANDAHRFIANLFECDMADVKIHTIERETLR